MMPVLLEQLRVRNVTVDLEHVRTWLRTNTREDYDAQKQYPIPGPYVKHETIPAQYLTRLEDIDASWVRQYVTNCLVGYKRNNGGLGDSKYLQGTNGVWIDSDGEVRQITEMDVVTDSTTGYDLNAARAKLPYLLKRVHQKSKELGCSLISIYGRYLCLQRVSNVTDPKPQAMLSMPIFKMDAAGHVTERYPVSANHNRGFPEAFAFIKGEFPDDPYYRDLLEFGHICDLLDIKLWLEDPHDYDQDFIDKMVVTYIASNKDFLWNGRRIDKDVLEALRSVSVGDYREGARQSVSTKYEAFVERIDLDLPEVPKERLTNFLNYYTKAASDQTFSGGMRHFHTYNGFICEPGTDEPYLFNANPFCSVAGQFALLHKSGWLMQYSSTKYVSSLRIEDAIVYMRQYFIKQARHTIIEGWGTWEYRDISNPQTWMWTL